MEKGEVGDLGASSVAAERKFRRKDTLESGSGHGHGQDEGARIEVMLNLALESIGAVFSDIGMSPLYVYSSTFSDGTISNPDDILGVLSLILYTLTFIALLKYIFFVLDAIDDGEDGTFGLYSLLCRHVNIGLIPSEQMEDQQCHVPDRQRVARCLKSKLENSRTAKILLLLATMLSTSMAICNGFFSPSISVLSAVEGIQNSIPSPTEVKIAWISVAILFCLFMVQRFGTYTVVGNSFAPMICFWFALLAGTGIYNFFKFDPSVIKAVNPKYIFDYFKRNKKNAWISLRGVVLAISGMESLSIDLGHFKVMSIRLSMCSLVYPALVSTYIGQASFLRKRPDLVFDSFYSSVPVPLYWLTLVVAMISAIISSHYAISNTFSIIQQSLSHGCFPRVKVVHTSSKNADQIYIPEINYLLMFLCLGITLGFKATSIQNGIGISVVFVMTLTSSFLVLVMILIWKTHILIIISYVLTIGFLEFLYLSSVLFNIVEGGYLPFVFSGILMTIMYTWNDVHRRKYFYELEHKISPEKLNDMIVSLETVNRVPGLALFYSELVEDIPPIFKHYLANVRTLQSVLVLVSFKSLPKCKVSIKQRFVFQRVKPDDINVFHCVVKYGYRDIMHKQESFENVLVKRLKRFIKESCMLQNDDGGVEEKKMRAREEMEVVGKAWKDGIVHLIGENEVVASKESGLAKRVLINYVYDALRRNMRQSEQVCYIPLKHRLKVGMTYEL